MRGVMGEVAALDVAAAQEWAVRLAPSRRIFTVRPAPVGAWICRRSRPDDRSVAAEVKSRRGRPRRRTVTADQQRRPTSADPPLSLAIH